MDTVVTKSNCYLFGQRHVVAFARVFHGLEIPLAVLALTTVPHQKPGLAPKRLIKSGAVQLFSVAVLLLISISTSACNLNAQTASETPAAKSKNQTEENYEIAFEKEPGALLVNVGAQLFTRYDYGSYAKPILYPVYGPGQLPMTRNAPMKPTAGEANDHPHHKSIWVGHEINGVDFWSEQGGSVQHQAFIQIDDEHDFFVVNNNWIKKGGTQILSDQTTYRFGARSDMRWIDVTIVFHASHGVVLFEDTKEGTFALRTHPNLRLSPDKKRGVEKVFGQALNSNGTTGKPIWGQTAKWVYYWGQINDKTVGVAIFDHPSNLRHPTTWHAREYGLVAANPFGLHYFKGDKKGVGEYTLIKGKSLSLRYRVTFQLGQQTMTDLNKQFETFAGQ